MSTGLARCIVRSAERPEVSRKRAYSAASARKMAPAMHIGSRGLEERERRDRGAIIGAVIGAIIGEAGRLDGTQHEIGAPDRQAPDCGWSLAPTLSGRSTHSAVRGAPPPLPGEKDPRRRDERARDARPDVHESGPLDEHEPAAVRGLHVELLAVAAV